MGNFKRYTVTAALPYANGPVHIGHLAGVYIPADIYVRYLRLKKKDVIFVSGTDEHGVPITIKAKQEGVKPQQIVDKYYNIIDSSFKKFGIEFDNFSRTTREIHKHTASDFFKVLNEKGEFIEKVSQQYFDEEAGQFLADRYITGTCPHCSNENAYGDQCEKCGTTLNATDLINPKSTISGNKPVLRDTKHWYLPLDKHEEFLKKWILDGHKEWKTNVYGQCKSWIDQGLQPRAVSRDLDWGIPVPLKGAEGKVLYVWFDAPIGYISATKELFEKKGNKDDWKKYWCDKETKLVHFIGKDNIVFHCIVFPSMLKAHGEFILPDNVPANEFLNLEGEKISTSRNWAVWLHEYLEDFPGKEDVLRYVLCANAPETKDNDFTWKDFQTRNNSELVGILGNFVNRALMLTISNFDSKVPERYDLTDVDKELIRLINESNKEISENIETFKFREALKTVINLARAGNKYLTETEPWKVIKQDKERVGTILNLALQTCANLAIAMRPFMPNSYEKICKFLRKDIYLNNPFEWDNLGKIDILKSGDEIQQGDLLFEKIEDADIENQLEKLASSKKANELKTAILNPAKPDITYEEFSKLDIRTGTVLTAEKVAKTKKLMKLSIDTGIDVRTVVSGIAEYYEPEQVIGRKVSILVNLQTRNLKGIDSHGMILMASDAEGRLVFVSPADDVKNGSEIK
jgi:methionyl-tRNA synthetase